MNHILTGVTINTNLTLESIAGGFISLIINIALYVGVIFAAIGLFNWLMAKHENNPADQNKAMMQIVIGAALVGLRVLLQLIGVIQ